MDDLEAKLGREGARRMLVARALIGAGIAAPMGMFAQFSALQYVYGRQIGDLQNMVAGTVGLAIELAGIVIGGYMAVRSTIRYSKLSRDK